jgi:hypothetical protein
MPSKPYLIGILSAVEHKVSAHATAPDHHYYAAVKDRHDDKRAALAEARKIIRRACHIRTELGDDAFTTV